MKLSVVSPVYKAEHMLGELVQRILALSIPGISEMELVLVEDGSPDQSWEEIKKAAANYPQVKGIQLSRNFGQHPAIVAGLQASMAPPSLSGYDRPSSHHHLQHPVGGASPNSFANLLCYLAAIVLKVKYYN